MPDLLKLVKPSLLAFIAQLATHQLYIFKTL